MQLIELSAQDHLTVEAGKLFTGVSDCFEEKMKIEIRKGRVRSIEKQGVDRENPPPCPGESYQVISSAESTVIPGFIDCHTHLALDAQQGFTQSCAEKLASYLAEGIIAVRDGGDREYKGLAYRNLISSGELKGPVVKASGEVLRKNDGYGSFLGEGFSSKELAKAMDKLFKMKIDQVKVLVSGIVSFKEYGKVGGVQFTLGELREIVEIAADHGLRVMAHANSDEAIRLAIKAGVHSIEHGYFLGEDSLRMMAEMGVFWVPTVIPVAVHARGGKGKTSVDATVIRRTYQRQLRMIRLAQDLGVILGVGTDVGAVGIPHGVSYKQE